MYVVCVYVVEPTLIPMIPAERVSSIYYTNHRYNSIFNSIAGISTCFISNPHMQNPHRNHTPVKFPCSTEVVSARLRSVISERK